MPIRFASLSPAWRHYALAALFSLSALALNLLLAPFLAPSSLVFLLASIALSAWLGGWGPGLAALAISASGLDYLFLPPLHSLQVVAWPTIIRLISFSGVSLGIIWLISQLRREHAKAENALRKAEAARAEQSFLAEASVLLTASLDYRVTFSGFVQLIATQFCDWCNIDIMGQDRILKRAFSAAMNAAGEMQVQDLQHGFPRNTEAGIGQFMLHTGRTLLIPDLAAAMPAAEAPYKALREYLRSAQIGSYIGVPLSARGRMVGVLSFGLSAAKRRFEADDLRLAEELARRAALALDNMLLYWQARETQSFWQHSEARYRSLVEATAHLVWTTSTTGEIETDWPAWRAITGQDPEAIKGWGWLDALHADDQKRVAQVWTTSIVKQTPFALEYRVRRFDGQYRHFQMRGVPVREQDGKVREWIGTCQDVTDSNVQPLKMMHSM